MFGILGGLFTGGSSILARIAGYGLIFLAGTASGAFLMHKLDAGKYEALVAANQRAVAIATQKAKDIQAATDKIALDDAVAEAKAQQQIVVQHDYVTQEIPHYVPVHVACITYGIVRLLDAASLGSDPANAPIPAGKSDDACSPVTARQLAASVLANYATALANAEQLNALEGWVRQTVAASSSD